MPRAEEGLELEFWVGRWVLQGKPQLGVVRLEMGRSGGVTTLVIFVLFCSCVKLDRGTTTVFFWGGACVIRLMGGGDF